MCSSGDGDASKRILHPGENVFLGTFDEFQRAATCRQSEELADRFKTTHTCQVNSTTARFGADWGDNAAFFGFQVFFLVFLFFFVFCFRSRQRNQTFVLLRAQGKLWNGISGEVAETSPHTFPSSLPDQLLFLMSPKPVPHLLISTSVEQLLTHIISRPSN